MSSRVLNISMYGGSITPLGNVLLCSPTCIMQMLSLIFKWEFTFVSLCPFFCVLTGHPWGQSGSVFTGACTHRWDPPEPSLLQAKPSQLFWPLLMWQMLRSPSLWSFIGLSPLCPCLSFTGEPSTHQCSSPVPSKEKDHLPQPADNVLPSTAQENGGGLCCKGTLLARGWLVVHQDLQVLLCKAALQPVTRVKQRCLLRMQVTWRLLVLLITLVF